MKHVIAVFLLVLSAAIPAAGFEQFFVRDISVESERVTAIAFDNDGRLMVYGTNDGRVAVVDIADGTVVFSSRDHGKDVTALGFDSRATFLISGARDGAVIIWNIIDGKPEKIIKDFGNAVAHLDISPDDRYLAVCGAKKEIMLWEFPSGFLRGKLAGHDKDVAFCAFDPGSSRLVSVGKDRAIIVWDTKSLNPIRRNDIVVQTLPNSSLDIVSAAMSDDRRFLAVGTEEHVLAKGGRGNMEFRHNIAFYDWSSGTLLKVLEGNDNRLDRLALSPDVTYLLTDNSPMHSHQIAFWDILGGIIETDYPIEGDITAFDFSMDGNHMAVAYSPKNENAHIALWELTGFAGYAPPASGTVTPLAETGFGGTISLTGPSEPVIGNGSGQTMAVMYLDANGIDDDVARAITGELEARLVNTVPCLTLVERNRIDLIVRELKYAQSGLTDQRAIEIGKHLEAQYLLYGNVRKMGHDLTISVKVADVQSMQILGARGVTCINASLRDIFDIAAHLAPTIAACGD